MTKKYICNYHDLSAENYDLNLASQEGEDAVVVGGACERCGADYRVERAGFKYHVVEFISAGEGTLVLHGKKYSLYPGMLFCFGPRVPHKIMTDPENPLVKHYVMFSGTELVDQLKATNLPKGPRHAPYPLRINAIFENLMATGRTESRRRNEQCILLLKLLLLQIEEFAILPKVSRSPAWQSYLRARDYIEQNFRDLCGLDHVAQECHVSKVYLCQLFKRYAHETPLQMLTHLKMRRAADAMLADPTQPIKLVADEAGYPDPYYFSRVFKRVFGVSPEAYIKTFRSFD